MKWHAKCLAKVLACISMASVRAADAAFSYCFLSRVLSAYGQTASLISIVLGLIFLIQTKVKLFMRKHRWLLCASSVHSHQLPKALRNVSFLEAITFVL